MKIDVSDFIEMSSTIEAQAISMRSARALRLRLSHKEDGGF